jgi:hypothetical protein
MIAINLETIKILNMHPMESMNVMCAIKCLFYLHAGQLALRETCALNTITAKLRFIMSSLASSSQLVMICVGKRGMGIDFIGNYLATSKKKKIYFCIALKNL